MNESGEWMGVENEWEWRMNGSGEWIPLLAKEGWLRHQIELIRSFKRRRRGGHFRLAFIVSSTYSKSL